MASSADKASPRRRRYNQPGISLQYPSNSVFSSTRNQAKHIHAVLVAGPIVLDKRVYFVRERGREIILDPINPDHQV